MPSTRWHFRLLHHHTFISGQALLLGCNQFRRHLRASNARKYGSDPEILAARESNFRDHRLVAFDHFAS